MKRCYSLLLLLLVYHLAGAGPVAQAQNTGTITGLVRDRATQELLPGVTVVLEGYC